MMNSGLNSALQVAYFEYNFDKDAGAVGAITLDVESVLPPGAAVKSGMITILTNCTSGGSATIALSIVGANDIYSAAAFTGFVTSARFLDVVPDGSASTSIYSATAIKGLTMTIGTAALTAGRFVVALEYLVPGI